MWRFIIRWHWWWTPERWLFLYIYISSLSPSQVVLAGFYCLLFVGLFLVVKILSVVGKPWRWARPYGLCMRQLWYIKDRCSLYSYHAVVNAPQWSSPCHLFIWHMRLLHYVHVIIDYMCTSPAACTNNLITCLYKDRPYFAAACTRPPFLYLKMIAPRPHDGRRVIQTSCHTWLINTTNIYFLRFS